MAAAGLEIFPGMPDDWAFSSDGSLPAAWGMDAFRDNAIVLPKHCELWVLIGATLFACGA